MLHTLPFRLQADKIIVQARVNGGRPQDFILDTGSEETVLSRETAQRERIRPVTYTLSAGVGEVGLRGLQLAQVKSLDFGTLQVRNLPVLIKNPALRGIPKREGESFSPLSIGMSMRIDYKQRLLTIGRQLPPVKPDVSLPMRINRLAMVRGLLNSTHPGLLRGRHRWRGDLHQLRDGERAARVSIPPYPAARVGNVWMGSRRVSDARSEPGFR